MYKGFTQIKILLFLSSMRSFRDELKSNNFKVHYEDVNSKFKTSYEKKIEKIILSRPAVEAGEKLGFLLKAFVEEYENEDKEQTTKEVSVTL